MIAGLSEARIRAHTEEGIFERGQEYAERGAVLMLIVRGHLVQAEVQGSAPTPYHVRIALLDGDATEVRCSAGDLRGGWCKHVVAALLTLFRQPDRAEQRPPFAAVLAPLERPQLQALLIGAIDRHPDLADYVESEIAVRGTDGVATGVAPAPAAQAPIDISPFRREMRAIFRGLDRMSGSEIYMATGGILSEVNAVVEQARSFSRAGDGRNALAVLEVVTEELLRGYEVMDDSDGEVGAFFQELRRDWIAALLTADLSPEERARWGVALERIKSSGDDYGLTEDYDAALIAAREGWDYPPLRAAIEGTPILVAPRTEEDAADDEDDELYEEDKGDEDEDEDGALEEDGDGAASPPASRSYGIYTLRALAGPALEILERRGRYESALRLARASGLDVEYATLLVRLDRTDEAMGYALEQFQNPGQALALARALYERGAIEGALRIGEHGLTLTGTRLYTGAEDVPVYGLNPDYDEYTIIAGGERTALAAWLSEAAEAAGQPALALRAAETLFDATLLKDAFERVRRLAGDQWPTIRERLLERIRGIRYAYTTDPVEIMLDEGLLDDAIALIDRGVGDRMAMQVADAALQARPEWVLARARGTAEGIMNAGRSDHYREAAAWLARARDAYRLLGRTDEWTVYIQELIATHRRKYRLRPLLEELSKGS